MTAPTDDAEQSHHLLHRQRLKERLLKGGAEALPDYELMELALFLVIPRKDVKPLAKQLLTRFGSFSAALNADQTELTKVSGIGENAAAGLRIIAAAAHRMAKSELIGRHALSSWDKVVDYCRISLAHQSREQFHLLFLDKKNGLIAAEAQQTGTVDHTPVYPREVVRRALELDASALIMVHNHPSGDPTPSRPDIEMTRQVATALQSVGIRLHDHLVIGRTGESSFKALGLL